MTDHVSVYATFPSESAAREAARELLEDGLVACANLSPIASLYLWEGALQEDDEVAAFMKTRADLVDDVEHRLVDGHDYDVPCVVAFPIDDGHDPYLAWVDDVTAG